MNEKEAREIIEKSNGITAKPFTFIEAKAKGYLEAIEKGKPLEVTAKELLKELQWVLMLSNKSIEIETPRIKKWKEALAKYRKDK